MVGGIVRAQTDALHLASDDARRQGALDFQDMECTYYATKEYDYQSIQLASFQPLKTIGRHLPKWADIAPVDPRGPGIAVRARNRNRDRARGRTTVQKRNRGLDHVETGELAFANLEPRPRAAYGSTRRRRRPRRSAGPTCARRSTRP